jgi:hypothetical protein
VASYGLDSLRAGSGPCPFVSRGNLSLYLLGQCFSNRVFDPSLAQIQCDRSGYPERVHVVFSVADLHTIPDLDDQIWSPAFKVDELTRFLGPA